MKVYAIIGKNQKNSNEKYLVGVLSDEDEAKAQMNYFGQAVKFDYYIDPTASL